MLTKSLSRTDYNREKKIVHPKLLERMGSQVPVRSHMLEATQRMAHQIRKFIQNKSQESHQISTYLAIEPTLYDFQIKVQDLKRVLANREDEITYLKNQKEKNQKKIQNLDKHIFDLKTQTQKLEYEYKNTIDFLKSQNTAQKAQYLERISFLEQESKKFKEQYENLLKSARQVYEFRINSFTETKESYKLASQQVVKGLKKDISFHVRQYERLKEEISLNGKSTVDKLQYYQEQNYRLKQKLTEKQLEFGFFIMNNSTDIKAKDTLIQNLHKQFEQMLKNFESQRQKFISEKDNIEHARNEKQMTLNKTIENVLAQKRNLQFRLHENQLQINEMRYENEVLNRKCIEYSAKLQIQELDKKAAIESLEKEILLLKGDNEQKLQREMMLLKRAHEQKILFFKNDIEEKDHEIGCLEEKICFLKKEILTKNAIIKDFEQCQKKCFMETQQKESESENLRLEIQKLKRQNELIKSGFEKQNKELKETMEKQRQQQIEKITKKFNAKIEIMNREINELKIRLNSQNNNLPFNLSRIKEIQKNLSNFDGRLSQIPESQSEIHEEDIPLQQMRMTIQKQGQALLNNEETINDLHLDLYKIKSQKVQKEVVINNLQKELKELQKEFEKVKNEAIRRYTELKQSSEQVCNKLDIENNKIAAKLQTALNEMEFLRQKNQNLQKDYVNLQAENQNNLIQNSRLKEAIMKKQQNSYQLIERLETKRIQGMNNIIQNLKNQNQTLRSIHQKNKQSFNILESKYSAMALQLKKKEVQIQELQNKERTNNKQILDLEGRIKSKEHIIQLLDQRLDDQGQQMYKTQTAKLQLQRQKQELIQKLSSYEQYSLQLRKLRIYDITQIHQILDQRRSLKAALQDKKIQVQCQIKHQKEMQSRIAEMQRQYEKFKQQTILQTTKNIMEQCRVKLEKESLILTQKHRNQHQSLLQKNAQLEEQIRQKQNQLKRANKKLYQSEENIKQECEKLSNLQRKIEIYKKQFQKVHKQLQDCKSLVQVKQRLIITLKSELQEYYRKEKTRERQVVLKKQQRVNRQELESLNPLEKIKQFRRLVDYFDVQRDRKYNSLSQQHRKIIDDLSRVNGYVRDLSTQSMLNQIDLLMKQIERLKSHKSRLIDFVIQIHSENKSKVRKFSLIISQMKQNYKQFSKLDNQLRQQIEKWSTITVSSVQLMKEQNLNYFVSESEQKQSVQSASIQQQIQTVVDGKYLSQQVPIVNMVNKQYVYDFNFEDDTIKKQSVKEQSEQTVQKKVVVKHNVRYGTKQLREK